MSDGFANLTDDQLETNKRDLDQVVQDARASMLAIQGEQDRRSSAAEAERLAVLPGDHPPTQNIGGEQENAHAR